MLGTVKKMGPGKMGRAAPWMSYAQPGATVENGRKPYACTGPYLEGDGVFGSNWSLEHPRFSLSDRRSGNVGK